MLGKLQFAWLQEDQDDAVTFAQEYTNKFIYEHEIVTPDRFVKQLLNMDNNVAIQTLQNLLQELQRLVDLQGEVLLIKSLVDCVSQQLALTCLNLL